MHAPAIVALVGDPVDRLIGEPGGLGQLVGDDRRMDRRPEQPARHELAVGVAHRVGGAPGVRFVEAVLAKEVVVRQVDAVACLAGSETVVAEIRGEAALGKVDASRVVTVESHALDPGGVCGHVGLADERRPDADEFVEVIAERALADIERDAVVSHAVRGDVPAGVRAHA